MNTRQLGELLIKTASLIEALKKERDEYKQKLAEYELRTRIDRLADEMQKKGMNQGLSEVELKERLIKQAKEGRLDVVEEAVRLSGGNSNFSGFYSPSASDGTSSGLSAARLTSFILNGSD